MFPLSTYYHKRISFYCSSVWINTTQCNLVKLQAQYRISPVELKAELENTITLLPRLDKGLHWFPVKQ